MRKSNYDKSPFVAVTDAKYSCDIGWDKIAAELRKAVGRGRLEKPILVVDCYPGVDEVSVLNELASRLVPKLTIHAADAYHPPEKIDKLVAPFLGDDESLFGRFSSLSLVNFFNAEPLWRFRRTIDELKEGLVLIVGCGASLIAWGHILVHAGLSRRTIQQRFHRNEIGNLGADNKSAAANLKYKRAFFVDWRVADRWKRPLIRRWDYVLDTNDPAEPKLAEAGDVRSGMREAALRPFRLVPAPDSAPWSKQFEKDIPNPGHAVEDSELYFDCMPEENSLLLGFGDARFEIPAIDLLFYQPRALLGESVQLRFKDGFPIRFSLHDTRGVENNRFHVHPPADHFRHHFALRHTQDENYYGLQAGADTRVYIGLRKGIEPATMQRDLKIARSNGTHFPAEKYMNQFPAKGHDHFLIPADTVYGGNGNSLVLQISATPYIFAFDTWKWGEPGRNGKAHATHLTHGQREQGPDRAKENSVNCPEPVANGDGWREEKMGLQAGNFVELRRHWFTKKVLHDTNGSINVLNLIAGEEAVVESPTDAFTPFIVHYAETFIIPAAVGEYTIRPHGPSTGKECATIKAFVQKDFLI